MGRHRITIRAVCVTLVALMLGWAGLAMADTHYRYATVDGRKLFYREAGDASKPSILLLHGFPFSSHMFRDLIPALEVSFRPLPGGKASGD